MSDTATSRNDYDAIVELLEQYLAGARSGSGREMESAFHEQATIFGHAGATGFAGPIRQLFQWNDQNGPATGLQARIATVDVVETVAAVRLELDDWTGHRFTDLFTLLKTDGQWKIAGKVFHLHDPPQAEED